MSDLPDPLDADPDDDVLAASAVVDGTATHADTVRVAGSVVAAELVARFVEDRIALGAPVAGNSAGRDAAVAAAMSAFDEVHRWAPDAAAAITGPVPITRGNVVALDRRRRQYRMVVGVAAAVVGVLGVGVVLSDRSDQDDRPISAEASISISGKQAGGEPASPLADSSDAGTGTDAAADQASDGVLSATEAAPATEAPAAVPAMTEGGPADTEAPADSAAPADGDSGGGSDPMAAVDTPEALRAWAATRPAGALEVFTCVPEGAEVLGEVTSFGVDAVVVRDPATGTLAALDALSCAVLLTSP